MSEKLEIYEDQKEARLNEFLQSFPQLQDPKERHYLYLSYDHHEEEEQLYEFWRDTVHDLFGKVLKRTYASVDEILKCFVIERKKPFGLQNILIEMRLRKEFLLKDEILDGTQYNEVGWITKAMSNLTSWFSSTPETINNNSQMVSTVWLENMCSSVVDWAVKQDSSVFSQK